MTSFFLANFADIATTSVGLAIPGFKEVGVLGSQLVESGHIPNAFIIRTAMTVGMIGLYALTKQNGSRWAFSVEKAVHIGNFLCWSAIALNTLQMSPYITKMVLK
jgi:hypothetical protein